jgi:hypothetical protein
MTDFKEFSGFQILERIELRGEDAHSWIAVVGAASDATSFATELESQSELNAAVRIVDIEGLLPADIREKLQSPSNDHVILIGFEGRTQEFWASIDINRSGFERTGGLFFWLTSNALSDLCRYAPNIKSYIGTAIFLFSGVKGALTSERRKERIEEFEEKFGMSNAQLIKKAEEHQIEPEPEFVEWLLLLGRGDLV